MTRRMGQIVKIEPNTFEISLFVEEIYINDTPLPHKNKGVHNSILFNKNGQLVYIHFMCFITS